jgi:hypothetical protein
VAEGRERDRGDEGGGLALAVSPPVQISGGDPTTECTYPNQEAYPERDWSFPGGDHLFAGYNFAAYNAAGAWNTWPTGAANPSKLAPADPGFFVKSDPWAATVGNNSNYLSYQLDDALGNTCLGIGSATHATLLNGGVWGVPVGCANAPIDSDIDDGPSIDYEFQTLWAVSSQFPEGGNATCGFWNGVLPVICLSIYRQCVGEPQSVSCPQTTQMPLTANFIGHATVTAYSSTAAIVAYRGSNGGGTPNDRIWLHFVDRNGVLLREYSAATGQPMGIPDQCTGCTLGSFPGYVPKCGGCADTCGEQSCMRLASKVHVSTRWLAGQTYAALTWDTLCQAAGPDGHHHYKVAWRILNITNVNNIGSSSEVGIVAGRAYPRRAEIRMALRVAS